MSSWNESACRVEVCTLLTGGVVRLIMSLMPLIDVSGVMDV